MDSTTENDYFELEPYDQYKSQEAKFQASLKWLFTKAYHTSIPKHLEEPFFEENELGKSLRNEIVKELISGKVYCAACKNIFNNAALNKSHQKFTYFSTVTEIFDQLATSSITVIDENDEIVTADDIADDSPFYCSSHLGLIDGLMTAYALRVMRSEAIVNSIKKYTNFDASSEPPSNLEQKCTLWLNKIMQTVLNCVETECETFSKQSSLASCQPHIHLTKIHNDISASLSNGSILAALLVFYTCDVDIDLADICLQENVGFEESVENLNMVKEYCDKNFATRPFCFNFEDFLYSPSSLKVNKLVFIAELFYYFEVQPISSLVCSNHFDLFKDYLKGYMKRQYHATTPFISARIGDITRNSFIKGSYTPPIQDNKTNQSKIMSSANTNGSFNSLLDNVNLDQSQNFDDLAASTNNGSVKLDEGVDADFQYHSMLTSRTYLKATAPTNRSTNNNNNQKQAASNESLKGSNIEPSRSSPTVAKSSELLNVQQQQQQLTTAANNLIKNSTSEPASIDTGMKTTRLSATTYLEQTVIANSTNSLNLAESTSNANDSKPQMNPDNKAVSTTSSSTSKAGSIDPGTGLVRRLSVTARPGDIFYKVKDVTESSTSDTLSLESEEKDANPTPKPNESQPKIQVNKSYTIRTNDETNQVKSPSANATSFGSLGRKTTTWNSKRNQTTNLGINPNQQAPKSENVTTKAKDENTVETNKVSPANLTPANGNAEPGSPLFNKELLSIRMQLKEKKSSMERDKRKLESELERQRQTIGKQVFLQVVQKKATNQAEMEAKFSDLSIPKFQPKSTPKIQVDEQVQQLKTPTESFQKDNAPRRQWDKSKNNLIDLENDNKQLNLQIAPQQTAAPTHQRNQKASSVSSSSARSSSASQSPPLNSRRNNPEPQQVSGEPEKTADISKAYYSRDEMMKTIEVLKSTTVALASKAATVVAAGQNTNSSSESAVKDIDSELLKANSKLAELQNEIARLSELQQQQQQGLSTQKSVSDNNSTKGSFSESNDLNEELTSVSKTESPFPENNETRDDENLDDADKEGDAFFISFGNGTAKREKPPALTPKKNLFIKTTHEKAVDDDNSSQLANNTNLLMTAVNNGKSTITKPKKPAPTGLVKNIEEDEDSSDCDLKQRKKELIMQKQLERRQQQEHIRQMREEERARKAEEIRLREEEAASKKQLEKSRKETIFQAYIDKKKQLSEETHTSYPFGGSVIAQNSLAQAKKYHSTYRLKQPSGKQPFDNDQASVISDRSTNTRFNSNSSNNGHQSQNMIKTYSTNNLYQGNYGNNHQTLVNNTPTTKRQSRVSRPPSCARPTISSLRKMNRTFSLNNVSDIGSNQLKQQQKHQESPINQTQNNSSSNMSLFLNTQNVVPLTQASLAAVEQQQQANFPPSDDSMMRMTLLNNANKLSSKYASSNYLSDYTKPALMNPQKTRTQPRRRTPRNAEEFLVQAGVQDPETYLSKGFYVGSMLNLNELNKSTPVDQQHPNIQNNFMSQQFHQQVAPVSSSSSSSTGGFQKSNQNHHFYDKDDQISNNLQRRNSVHESTSISMANLNFMNNNFNAEKQANLETNSTKNYYRQKGPYTKQRSATTAIIDTSDHGGFSLNENQHESTATTTGSSAPSSDSSSSPNPLHIRNNQKQANLGPLMSAVSKLETDVVLNSPRSGLSGFIEQRFFNSNQNEVEIDDDFDEYEYLERNLGAEPPFTSNALLSQRRTLENNGLEQTTTNVTDYYTDESNSCNNDAEYPQFNSSKTLCNPEEPVNNNGSYLNVNYANSSFSVGGITPNSQNNFYPNNGNNMSNMHVNNMPNSNSSASTTQLANLNSLKPSPRHINGNGWEQASVVSNNSLFSVDRNNHQTRSTSVPVRQRSPKLFKRLTGKSNKLAILNSLNHRVLAGVVNASVRKQVVDEIEASDERHFIILFRDYHLQYRAIYSYTSETDYIEKVVGVGPAKISEDMVETFFKYNSGGRQFTSVPTKHFSVQCDGVAIHSIYWGNRKTSNPSTNVAQIGGMNNYGNSHSNYATTTRR